MTMAVFGLNQCQYTAIVVRVVPTDIEQAKTHLTSPITPPLPISNLVDYNSTKHKYSQNPKYERSDT